MDDSNNGNTEFIPHKGEQQLARPDEILPDTLQLIPLVTRPYFPVLVQPVVVDQDPWGKGIRKVAESAHKLVAMSFSPTTGGGIPAPDDICKIGCVARIHRLHESKGKLQFIAQGIRRFRIREWVKKEPPYVVRVDYFDSLPMEDESQLRAYAMSIINIIKELMTLNPLYNEELKQYLNYFDPNEPSPLTDFAAAITSADALELQDILETIPLLDRMAKVLLMIGKELEVARLQAQITEQMQEQVSEQQKEFFLRQQLKVIQQELGISKDDRESDAEKYSTRLKKLNPPDHVTNRVEEELQKLQVLEPTSSEYGVTRNYLDWVTSVPWGVLSVDKLDLADARQVLDRDHDGLDDVKQRIIEFLAVGAYRGEIAGSILLLVGPPGVGKTSIGKSVASALGRKFFRFSLGGMRDEAEIKGHRRTYVGAMPGKMIQALKEVEVYNPVIMLDEVDKVGVSYQGDPASALLEVLDPEQNNAFLDHYLDLRVDLSKVLFICTANQLDTIPNPLLDRMEVIRLAGYLTEEKVVIAKHHLWKRQLKKAGIPASKLKITDGALRKVVEGYAREAGVRALDKQLGRIVRKSVVSLLEDNNQKISVSVKNLETYIGEPLFKKQRPHRGVGVINGLAWTAMGGTTLAIEASRIHDGSRGFKQTGQLGDVMRESAQIAYSFVASHLEELGGAENFFDDAFVHLHVPEGATPKDGPSAGITMAAALLSLAKNKKVGRDLAMTGELTLTGRVLPVGGIREKVIAARRAGVKELILPADTERDIDEMPDYLKKGLIVNFVSEFGEVADLCF
ncbi:MAG: endopeptidase La [Gammaproteobacteria bacterium]|jgi:ATP-dependent Lon protease|nr:endopeptidase La [Gammaproteobacteria bacterium]|tara:strand:+ start:3102 stop:5486 length:2385 start_codon:yes stop_codon:yes gene_type:complete